MVKSLNYFHSVFLFFLIGLFASCQETKPLYKKEIPPAEHKKLSENLVKGIFNYYQGTPAQQFLLEEAKIYDPDFSDIYREIGVPYLKRGFAHEYFNLYDKAVKLNPLDWQAWRGYLYLFFYRDYENALKDLIAGDELTPGVVDYPQSLNIDYLKAICYLKMDDQKKAIEFFDKQIKYETETTGKEYMEPISFLYRGIAYYELQDFEKARSSFEIGKEIDPNGSDIYYWLAKYWYQKGNKINAKKYAQKAHTQFLAGYDIDRPYVEAFYQTYLADIEELQNIIEPTLAN